MEKIIELLKKALDNARIMAIVEFDAELYVFSSALQALVRQAEAYVAKKKSRNSKKANVDEYMSLVRESLRMVKITDARIAQLTKGDGHVG